MARVEYNAKPVVKGGAIEIGQLVYETGETAYAPRFRWMPKLTKHIPGLRVKRPVVRAASPTQYTRVIGMADGKGNVIVMPPKDGR